MSVHDRRYKGEIADLARDLRKKLRENKFDKVAGGISKYFKEFNEYDTCYNVLGAMVKQRCGKACRNGGGPPMCKVKTCCNKKGINGCWECGEFETCNKLDFLKPIHEDACIKNLKMLKKDGLEAFVDGKRYY